MARLVLCGLVLVNLGVFAGSRLASWSGKSGEEGSAAATKSTVPRRALGGAVEIVEIVVASGHARQARRDRRGPQGSSRQARARPRRARDLGQRRREQVPEGHFGQRFEVIETFF